MPEMLTDHSEIDVSVPNENQDLSNTSLTLSSFEKSDSSPKTCNNCNNIIQEHAVKALGNIYHQNCFKCYDCGNVCKPKYFPFTINDESTNNTDKQVPLCQNDYFKRNNLICDVCKNLLKGTYYNAFGRLYDEEHFSCKICKETCSLQECFNFEGNLYCKFHYLKSYSKKCKGCEYPITDQHFEFERSGKIYRWHPECYGIHRYWHIDLRPSVLALPEFSQTPNIDDNVQISEKEKNDLTRSINISQEYNYKTWSILYKFEEESATCISDMLQFLTHEDKTKGTDAAALLVLKVNCLFKAIDSIQSVSGSFSQSRDTPKEIETDNNENIDETNNDNEANEDVESTQQSTQESIHTKYKKYPKSFSSRVMMYLQLLRKYDINEINKDKADSNGEDDSSILSSAMSIINGLSHYLKLLIKFGVYNVLEYNKNAHSVNALEKFLREVNKSSQYKTNPFSTIKDVNIDSTDSCEGCGKYIQQECIVFKNKRWHVNCLKCDKCKNVIERYDILDANYNSRTNSVLCPLCSTCDPNAESGFVPVSRLNNLTYLLKIALVKTRALVIIQMRGQNITNEVRTSSMLKEQSYMKTLNDIKNFRSKRNSMKIKKTSEKNLDENIKSTNAASSNEHNHSQETIHQFNNSKTLTLDDISRIVAMEQSRVGKVEPVAAKRPVTPTSKSVSSVLDTKKAEATSSVPIIPSRLKKMNSAFEVSSNKSLSKDRSPDLNVKTTNTSSGFKHYNKYEKNDKEESYEIYYSDLSSDHLYKIQLISLAILISNAEKKNVGDVESILKLLKSNSNPVIVSPTLSNKFWSKLKSHSKKHGVNEPSSGENYAGNVSGSSPTPEQRSFNPDLGNNKDFDLSKSAKGVYEQPTQVFGVSLNKLTEAHGVDSDLSLGSNRIRIPLVLDELIASLKQLDLSMEGLFRINGNIRKLREFTEEINANPGNVPDFSGENAIQLAALLKKFFRELPEPLLTTTLYNLWAGSMHDLDRMKLVYALLPKYHRNCCEVLFSFLKYVSTFSSGSKMDIHNLGTVFAPNILYSSEENTHADSGIAIQVVEDLIRSNEQMVSVPDNLMELLKKTLDAKLTTDFATINDYLKSKNII